MSEDGDEMRRLRGQMDDLLSLLALPALWTFQEPAQVLATLLEVLVRMLRLDVGYAHLGFPGRGPVEGGPCGR